MIVSCFHLKNAHLTSMNDTHVLRAAGGGRRVVDGSRPTSALNKHYSVVNYYNTDPWRDRIISMLYRVAMENHIFAFLLFGSVLCKRVENSFYSL